MPESPTGETTCDLQTARTRTVNAEVCNHSLRAGAQAYLTKPPDVDLLLAEIERLIAKNNKGLMHA